MLLKGNGDNESCRRTDRHVPAVLLRRPAPREHGSALLATPPPRQQLRGLVASAAFPPLNGKRPLTTQQCSGAGPSRHFASIEKVSESTFYASLAECEDWPHPRVDHRAGVMLVGLRALRTRLLRRDRRSRHALGSCIPRLGRHVLVRVLHKSRGSSARSSVALCSSRRPSRYGAKLDGALLQ